MCPALQKPSNLPKKAPLSHFPTNGCFLGHVNPDSLGPHELPELQRPRGARDALRTPAAAGAPGLGARRAARQTALGNGPNGFSFFLDSVRDVILVLVGGLGSERINQWVKLPWSKSPFVPNSWLSSRFSFSRRQRLDSLLPRLPAVERIEPPGQSASFVGRRLVVDRIDLLIICYSLFVKFMIICFWRIGRCCTA